jgi:hypothetical protein
MEMQMDGKGGGKWRERFCGILNGEWGKEHQRGFANW